MGRAAVVMEQLEQQIQQALSSGDYHKVASLSEQLASLKDQLASASEELSSEPIVFGMADVCTAATAGDAVKMRQFLKQDAKAVITARNAQRKTGLMLAALNGHTDVVAALMTVDTEELKGYLDQTDHISTSALNYAARAGHTQCIQLMLDAGADLEAIDYEKCTAINAACYIGKTKSIEALIRLGANTEAKDSLGKTALVNADRLKNGQCKAEIISLLTASA